MGKGGNFERQVSRQLSLWWTQDLEIPRDDIFWRNRLRRTTKTPTAEAQLGDLKADDPIGAPLTETFNIECKDGYSKNRGSKKFKNIPWDLLEGIDYTERKGRKESYQPTILSFWGQCLRDSKISDRLPWLIFKRDYHVPISVIERRVYNTLEKWQGDGETSYIIYVTGKYDDLFLFRLEQFLDWLQPDTIHHITKGYMSKSIRRKYEKSTINKLQ